jgi:outer membrane protein
MPLRVHTPARGAPERKGPLVRLRLTATGFSLLGLAFVISACHTGIREIEPSESFRLALEEVMLRQPDDQRVRADQMDRRREPVILQLSLDDCIELAMSHNRPVLFERLNAQLAAADVIGSRAHLDFRIGAHLQISREEQEIDARFAGDDRDKELSTINNYGINATLPFATGTTVELTTGFVRNVSNSPFRTFRYFPASTVTIRQQLLNGAGFIPNLGPQRMAEGELRIADWQVEASRNEQALMVAMAYWNLVEAEQELGVLYQQEELATDALELASSRLEAEIGTRLDVLAQEANLKSQQVQIIQAETLVEQRTDELLYAIHPDLIHGYLLFNDYRIIIESQTQADPTRFDTELPNLQAEIRAGLRRRPEIRQARQRILNAGIALDMSEFELLPQLEINADFGVRGFGDTFEDSWDNYTRFRSINYGMGATFSVPLQNSAARASMMRSELGKRRAILLARETETTIILEVAQAVRQLSSARRAIDAAEEAARLQTETYAAEQERQRSGLATSFEVKQALSDLTTAELNLVKARIALERSRLELQKATGELGR